MCGIAGVWYRDGALPTPESLAAVSQKLARRGPDGEGFHREAGLGLVHRRLAIIDLSSRGAQPMAVDGGRLWLVFNGEIYNYQELRRSLEGRFHFESGSDSEVILRLYDAHADEPLGLLRKLRGMFAFALWDGQRRRLLLARDRFGIKPLFVHESKAGVFFGSTLDALTAFSEVPRQLDATTLFDQLSLMCPPGPHSCIAGIRQIEPGTAMIVEGGGSRERRYWQLTLPEARWLEPATAAAALEPKLAEAVGLHLVADVEVGAFLSGGIDSGLVTAYANRIAQRPLRTFSAIFPGDEADESPWAREAAERLGSPHTEVNVAGSLLDDFEDVVAAMDQPLGLESAVPLFRIARAASQRLKVVLTGDGGDEVFAGYNRHRHGFGSLSWKVAWIPEALRPVAFRLGTVGLPLLMPLLGSRAVRAQYLLGTLVRDLPSEYLERIRVLSPAMARALLRPDLRAAVDGERHLRRIRELWGAWPESARLHRLLAVDLSTTLVDEMMAKSDRMTMAWGLEGRVPLLDHELVEAAFGVAPEALCSETLGKLPLRQLAAAPLGQQAATRRKYGFGTSLGRDLRAPGASTRLERLLERALEPGLFQRDAVSRLRARAESGDSADLGGLMAVLTAGLWASQRGLKA